MIQLEQVKALEKSIWIDEPEGRNLIRDIVLDFVANHQNVEIETSKYDEVNTSITLSSPKNKVEFYDLHVYIRPRFYDQKIRTGPTSWTYVKAYCGQEIEVYGVATNSYSVTWSEKVEAIE